MAVRITHEAQAYDECAFLTLTYNDAHMPEFGSLSTENKENEWQREVDRHHLSKFWKRARKAYGKMRYYAVGEYGDKSLRPHYHACVFGHAFIEDRIILRRTPTLLWTSPKLIACWGLGDVSVGVLNFQTARYTASYVTKKLRSKQKYVRIDEKTGELIPLEQPRAYMSRNIARRWWESNRDYVTAHDQVVIQGRPQKPPRAYDRWLKEKSEVAAQMQQEQRKTKHKAGGNTPEKNRARARNAHARVKQKNKSV